MVITNFHSQTELVINTHHSVVNTHNMVSGMHCNMLKIQEGMNDQCQVVSDTCALLCQDMVFFKKLLFRPICHLTLAIHATLFVTVSRLFPYSSRSLAIVPNASRRLAIFALFSPYASLFLYYLSYADYDYLISPFHSHCICLPSFMSFSPLPLIFFSQGHTEGTNTRRIRLARDRKSVV